MKILFEWYWYYLLLFSGLRTLTWRAPLASTISTSLHVKRYPPLQLNVAIGSLDQPCSLTRSINIAQSPLVSDRATAICNYSFRRKFLTEECHSYFSPSSTTVSLPFFSLALPMSGQKLAKHTSCMQSSSITTAACARGGLSSGHKESGYKSKAPFPKRHALPPSAHNETQDEVSSFRAAKDLVSR